MLKRAKFVKISQFEKLWLFHILQLFAAKLRISYTCHFILCPIIMTLFNLIVKLLVLKYWIYKITTLFYIKFWLHVLKSLFSFVKLRISNRFQIIQFRLFFTFPITKIILAMSTISLVWNIRYYKWLLLYFLCFSLHLF